MVSKLDTIWFPGAHLKLTASIRRRAYVAGRRHFIATKSCIYNLKFHQLPSASIARMMRQASTPSPREIAVETSGSTAVEFAILAPVYLLLILGMTAYGVYFGAAHSVQQLSADAARTAIAGLDAQERQTLALRFIDSNADGYIFIDRARLAIEVGDNQEDANQFDVILAYDASKLPIWGLWDALPMPDQTIRRRATIRMGGI